MEVQLQTFLTLAPDEGQFSASHPDRFTPGEIVSYLYMLKVVNNTTRYKKNVYSRY